MPALRETRDYGQLYEEFKAAKAAQPGLSQKAWCASRAMSYFVVSREFAPLRLEDAKKELQHLAPRAAHTLARMLRSADEGIQLKAAVAILDRVGMNPQGVNITMAQNVQTNYVIPPLFEAKEKENFRRMMAGDESTIVES